MAVRLAWPSTLLWGKPRASRPRAESVKTCRPAPPSEDTQRCLSLSFGGTPQLQSAVAFHRGEQLTGHARIVQPNRHRALPMHLTKNTYRPRSARAVAIDAQHAIADLCRKRALRQQPEGIAFACLHCGTQPRISVCRPGALLGRRGYGGKKRTLLRKIRTQGISFSSLCIHGPSTVAELAARTG